MSMGEDMVGRSFWKVGLRQNVIQEKGEVAEKRKMMKKNQRKESRGQIFSFTKGPVLVYFGKKKRNTSSRCAQANSQRRGKEKEEQQTK